MFSKTAYGQLSDTDTIEEASTISHNSSTSEVKTLRDDSTLDLDVATLRDEELPNPQRSRVSADTWYYASYIIPLVITFHLLSWPWIFFFVVWCRDGVILPPSVARVITTRRQIVAFLTTLVGTLFTTLTSFFFSMAIVCFFQKRIQRHKGTMGALDLSFFMSLRYQVFPWGLKELWSLVPKLHLVIITIICISTFQVVPSSISALLAPTLFNSSRSLENIELDFTSNNTECRTWFAEAPINTECRAAVSAHF